MSTPSNDYEWKRCRGCRLYSTRRNVVLTRIGYCRNGRLLDTPTPPSSYPRILFIGEAPEAQDDHTGLPFQGDCGRILHTIFKYTQTSFTYYLTHTIGCRPTAEDYRGDYINRTPSPPEIEACRPRLEQLVNSVEFQGVVYVGKTATSFQPKDFLGPKNLFHRALELAHPSAILKMEFKLHSIKLQALNLENYAKSTTLQGRESLHR